jgi:DNA ligase 1
MDRFVTRNGIVPQKKKTSSSAKKKGTITSFFNSASKSKKAKVSSDNGTEVSSTSNNSVLTPTTTSKRKHEEIAPVKETKQALTPGSSPENVSNNSKSSNNSNSTSKAEAKKQKIEASSGSSSKKNVVTPDVITTKSSDKVKGSFHPINDAAWKRGENIPYRAIVEVFEKIEATTKRLEIEAHLCSFLRSVIALSPDSLLACVYLACNQVAPGFENVELGLGEALLKKSIVQTTGTNLKFINKKYVELGDLGLVAQHYRGKQKQIMFTKPKPLGLVNVFSCFKEIAAISGSKSQDKKCGKIKKLLVDSKGLEAKYIIRGLQGKLRIGMSEQTVLKALSMAFSMTSTTALDRRVGISEEKFTVMKDANEVNLKQAFSEIPSFDAIVPGLLKAGCEGINKICQLTAGIPVKPMLAKPTKGVSEVLDRFEGLDFTCEFKYDGERGQVHLLEDGTVKVFSRNMENNTSKYPDVISMLPKALKPGKVTSCIMDSEIVAFDCEKKTLMPFQSLSTRSKKNTKEEDIKIQVIMTAFDLLYLNGESLLHKPLSERRRLLFENFQEVENKFSFVVGKDCKSVEEIEVFLDESIKGNCEGLMVKTLDTDATYEPSKRSLNWLKLKKDYLEGMGDSLDLVPIAAWRGKGKRTGWYGAYLCACYNPDDEEFQTVCKIGTGFSDENLEKFYNFFNEKGKERILPVKPMDYNVRSDAASLRPDIWLKASAVWEVKAADLSISPAHTAAIGEAHDTKGIALRFPRLLRVRDDKDVLDATSSDQVLTMFNEQANRQD